MKRNGPNRSGDHPGFDDGFRRRVVDALLETNSDFRNTVFIGGTGRSGTTWLAELLNHDNHYRYIFEPFQARYMPLARPFFYGLYLRPEDDNPAYLEPARMIMSGQVRHRWCDRFNQRLFSTQRIVKEVRGNLWLKWLRNHFPGCPMIFMMRHPFAVAVSRRSLDWASRSRAFFMQPTLQEDFPGAFWERFQAAESNFERYVFDWAVQHYVPLRQFNAGDFHYVFYEDLCTHPERVARDLFRYAGRSFSTSMYRRLATPSRTSRDGSTIRSQSDGEQLVASWRSHVTVAEIQRGLEILNLFGLDLVYDAQSMPLQDGLLRFTTNAKPHFEVRPRQAR